VGNRPQARRADTGGLPQAARPVSGEARLQPLVTGNHAPFRCRTLQRRIEKVEAWLAKPELLEADKDAEYAAVIEIDLADIKEPILCCPNDPDDAKTLSDVAGTKIDEAFIGSCMTNIGHFRAAAKLLGGSRDIPVNLWVAPPTKMDESELIKEGHYASFGAAGARTEMPGCSLCMGNQAQVREGATVVSTSTRNFPNRLGKNTNVFLASAELAAIASKLGHIPTVAEYHEAMGIVNKDGAAIYKYLNFHPATGVTADAVGQVQASLRKRILRAFVGRGLLESFEAQEMLGYKHSGVSVDTSVCIAARSCAAMHTLVSTENPLCL